MKLEFDYQSILYTGQLASSGVPNTRKTQQSWSISFSPFKINNITINLIFFTVLNIKKFHMNSQEIVENCSKVHQKCNRQPFKSERKEASYKITILENMFQQ